MAVAVSVPGRQKPSSDASLFTLCPFWSSRNANQSSSKTVSSVARSLLPPRRRLRLDPSNYLYFPYEPGKQVRSAVRLKNTSKSHVAFKFQTTAPKSCYMRPPGGILAPGESLIATVFKFVEQPENNEKLSDQKHKVKFKIMSLKVKEGVDYVPELFDEQKELVTVERILRVVFIDPARQSPVMEKLKRQLAEADAAVECIILIDIDLYEDLYGQCHRLCTVKCINCECVVRRLCTSQCVVRRYQHIHKSMCCTKTVHSLRTSQCQSKLYI
ncbi:vesicle-associated protein 4-1-like isoform X1 [Glycine soja]|uniref:vesicle-associated protein 4-1-like isoform X1 n=2 Tax=Glycine soja TaxID=3848 RepID=UPI00103B4194|nr:vesicle-associated protein 4-1-like isoform X1 [Glycine soja]